MPVRYSVKWSEKAEDSIFQILSFIAYQGFPENANKFYDRLETFGNNLGFMPNKFPLCRHKQFSRLDYRCAVFDDNNVFVYKVKNKQVFIYNIVHSMSLG